MHNKALVVLGPVLCSWTGLYKMTAYICTKEPSMLLPLKKTFHVTTTAWWWDRAGNLMIWRNCLNSWIGRREQGKESKVQVRLGKAYLRKLQGHDGVFKELGMLV